MDIGMNYMNCPPPDVFAQKLGFAIENCIENPPELSTFLLGLGFY